MSDLPIADRVDELARDERYPISRWYLRPIALRVARVLAATPIRPWQVSLLGMALAMLAAVGLAANGPSLSLALIVLAAWFCDRVDGPLARRRRLDSPRGAWLDANLDELADLAWHIAAGAWLSRSSPAGWPLALAFVASKYLFHYGLSEERTLAAPREAQSWAPHQSLGSAAYRFLGNADVRVHLFSLALATGWLEAELALVAGYYLARAALRYGLVLSRLPATASTVAAPNAPEADGAGLSDVSVVLVVRDEADNLRELLPRLGWAGEVVVVVDDRTRDESARIARDHGCVVAVRRFENFQSQRNFAAERASRAWLFSLDADERPTPALLAELAARLGNTSAAAFRVPIRSHILGAPFRFSGTQDDRPIRVFRRGAAHWRGAVHERLVVAREVETLAAGCTHRTLATRAVMRAKIERYTDLAAASQASSGQAAAWRPIYAAAREFFRRWIWKQGFRDGPAGLEFALWSGYSEWVLARKIRRNCPARRLAAAGRWARSDA